MRDSNKALIQAFDGRRYMVDTYTQGFAIETVKLGQNVIIDIDRKRCYVVCIHYSLEELNLI